MHAAQLCYIEYDRAYFTTQSLDTQWGDDWNDAPYEHNAGRPYAWHPDKWVKGVGSVPNDEPRWVILEVPFQVDLDTPAEHSHSMNSNWSVQQINKGATPWLISPDYAKHAVKVWAGTSLGEFIKVVESLGGRVWFPLDAKA